DRVLIERLVTNLVDNAVRYNFEGGSIYVETGTAGGESYLSITNSGPLVPEWKLPWLFEPFTRLEQRVANGKGVGLGLSIVASVVTAHHGRIDVDALPNGGLKITVRFLSADAVPAPPLVAGG